MGQLHASARRPFISIAPATYAIVEHNDACGLDYPETCYLRKEHGCATSEPGDLRSRAVMAHAKTLQRDQLNFGKSSRAFKRSIAAIRSGLWMPDSWVRSASAITRELANGKSLPNTTLCGLAT